MGNKGNNLPYRIHDRNSYKKIFDLYYKSLTLFASKFVKDADDVDDLVQDSFIALWENRNSIRSVHSVKAYLYTTLRNKCLSFLRKTKRLDSNSDAIKQLEDDVDFSNELIKEETFRLFYRAVGELKETAQKIIMLTLEGFKREEIAKKLGVSIDTVKYHKKSAFHKLKQILGENFHLLVLLT